MQSTRIHALLKAASGKHEKGKQDYTFMVLGSSRYPVNAQRPCAGLGALESNA
jgi:hypothetical protein